MLSTTCPNCDKFFGAETFNYIGDHVASCGGPGKIYDGGQSSLITFAAFLTLIATGALVRGIWLMPGLSDHSSLWAWPMFLVALLLFLWSKNEWKALISGTEQVVGEATFTVERGEASTWHYVTIAGQKFGIVSDVYDRLKDGDRITVNYYGNDWVKSVYLNV